MTISLTAYIALQDNTGMYACFLYVHYISVYICARRYIILRKNILHHKIRNVYPL